MVTKTVQSSSNPLSNPLIVSGIIALLSAAIQYIPYSGMPSITGVAASTKPYRTWTSFYPHYKTEHTNSTNRLLHLVGTIITSTILVRSPYTILAGVLAGSIGYILTSLLAGLQNGALEGIIVFMIFAYTTRQLTGSYSTSIIIPLIAYSFAWFGHFFHEHNKPATFLYPTYSLISDYYMIFNILTGREAI